jgi:hypothetical protein
MAIASLATAGGVLLIVYMLIEAFETIVLPRRVTRRYRFTRLLYRTMWPLWRFVAARLINPKRRETFLSIYGPLSLIGLLLTWAGGIIVGFAAIQWAMGSSFATLQGAINYGIDLYVSATTFFTLGLGDVYPVSALARALTVLEVANGYAVLALVISYLPTLYQSFSRREAAVSLLDARAGSPPNAVVLLQRTAKYNGEASLPQYLHEWELWAADLMESHLSYPALAYFRSQHENQSWLAALTTVLDACALIIASGEEELLGQAKLTFAICRHFAVDLSQVFYAPPRSPSPDRLPPEAQETLHRRIAKSGLFPSDTERFQAKLDHLRSMYEPYVYALAETLMLQMPDWLPPEQVTEDWLTTSWEPRPRIGSTLF